MKKTMKVLLVGITIMGLLMMGATTSTALQPGPEEGKPLDYDHLEEHYRTLEDLACMDYLLYYLYLCDGFL